MVMDKLKIHILSTYTAHAQLEMYTTVKNSGVSKIFAYLAAFI